MKRKLRTILTALAVLLLCRCAALAAGQTCVLGDVGAEITAPEGEYHILTRGMDENDPTLASVGMTAAQVDALLESNDMYLSALPYDVTYEVDVQVLSGGEFETVFNNRLLSTQQRGAVEAETRVELEKQGYTVNAISHYDGAEAVFLVVDCALPGGGGWMYQYQTIYNGKAVVVSSSSSSLDEVTEEIKAQTKAMADAVHFTRTDPAPEPVKALFATAGFFSGMRNRVLLIGILCIVIAAAVFAVLERRKKKKAASAQALRPSERLDGGEEARETEKEDQGS